MSIFPSALEVWASRLPPGAEVAIDEGGLTLVVVDDPEMPHDDTCQPAPGGCTCWKSAYFEVGGVPEELDSSYLPPR